ncbi:DMT family transporter [Castellaniella sp. MT123]|uniref:DMT family transporter n=1 Tax=Castellaniella sp. MT123 TaxID=3140381 RepID=UPI0031F3A566|nr:DMT family transporter [Castellaniella sp.]
MNERLTPGTVALLLIPPVLWASNAVVGRAVVHLVPPLTLNFLRWAVALLLLLPLGYRVLRPGSDIWRQWPRYALLGLLGVGLYNSLQYLALHTSSPINVTLVMASIPVWMLIVGRVFHGVAIRPGQVVGSVLSLAGVATVLSHGEWTQLWSLHFVPGDLLMVLATFIWAVYSWQLTRVPADAPVRAHWAGFLLGQILYGAAWSGLFAALEWGLTDWHVVWGWQLALTVAFVAIGPAVIAFRCWGAGVQRVGPTLAGFFNNLTPLIAALLSLALLGERPHPHHAVAFLLIIGGIVLSSRRKAA